MTSVKTIFVSLAFVLLLGPAVTHAQIGGALKDKAKNATGAKSNSNNDSKATSADPSGDVKAESASGKGGDRDEYGVLISDPAIDAAVKDKNAFYMTRTSDLYRYLNTQYKQAPVIF